MTTINTLNHRIPEPEFGTLEYAKFHEPRLRALERLLQAFDTQPGHENLHVRGPAKVLLASIVGAQRLTDRPATDGPARIGYTGAELIAMYESEPTAEEWDSRAEQWLRSWDAWDLVYGHTVDLIDRTDEPTHHH